MRDVRNLSTMFLLVLLCTGAAPGDAAAFATMDEQRRADAAGQKPESVQRMINQGALSPFAASLFPKAPLILYPEEPTNAWIAKERSRLSPYETSISPEKARFFPGEPMILNLRIRNPQQVSGLIDLGREYGYNAFALHITDESGAVVSPNRRPIRWTGGWMAFSASFNLDPGAEATHPLVVNRWASTNLTSGTYAVHCRIQPSPLAEPLDLECDVKILPAPEAGPSAWLETLREESAGGAGALEEVLRGRTPRNVRDIAILYAEAGSPTPEQKQVLESSRTPEHLQEDVEDVVSRTKDR